MIIYIQESRPTYSCETHPMNGTNQLNGTSITILTRKNMRCQVKIITGYIFGVKI